MAFHGFDLPGPFLPFSLGTRCPRKRQFLTSLQLDVTPCTSSGHWHVSRAFQEIPGLQQ